MFFAHSTAIISSNSDSLIFFCDDVLLMILDERISMTPSFSVCFSSAVQSAGMKAANMQNMLLILIELS